MSLTRAALALAVAGAAVVPAGAQAIVEYCVQPTSTYRVCHAPERPGCVHGHVNRLTFETSGCGR